MTALYTLHTSHPDDTQAIGRQIGQLLHETFRAQGHQSEGPLTLLALNGELGAGKTTFTQGLAAGLGLPQTVTSPTFTLVNEYELEDGLRLIHMDSYRLGDPSTPIDNDEGIVMDAATFGLEEILEADAAVIVIEWADRLAAILPSDLLHIQLGHLPESDQGRSLLLRATGPQSATLIEKLRMSNAP